MSNREKDRRLVRKSFEDKSDKVPDKIRLGNNFVDDFIFEDSTAADIPINALRVIFNIVSIISNNQFQPQNQPRQLSIFDEEFETEHNIFASFKIRNNKISPSGSTKQVVDAYEFLARFKMGWYKSQNSAGKEIKTFGGLICTPTYDQRGFTTFLISSYWLKKLMVIPEYNYILYNLVYNIRNNKHIIFAIWLSKVPENGTVIKLSTMNKKFGLNYKTANDFCFKFLKPAQFNFDKFSDISFKYRYKGENIFIDPVRNQNSADLQLKENLSDTTTVTRRLRYFSKRYGLEKREMEKFAYIYRSFPQTRELIERAFVEFIRINRLRGTKSTDIQGMDFLGRLQELIIQLYRESRTGKILPDGYPSIL